MSHTTAMHSKVWHWRASTILAVLAAILYSSWPLGDWLNPAANRGLASDLEALHQPYNWLFISLDVMSGLCVCAGAVLLGILSRHRSRTSKHHALWLQFVIIGFGMFGLLTAVDAILPLDCVSVVQTCPAIIDDPLLIIHGIASIGSIAGLTLSIVSMWYGLAYRSQVSRFVRIWLYAAVLIFIGFGLLTAWLILVNESSALAQHVFITFCSVWTAGIPYFVKRAMVGPIIRPLLRKKVSAE